MGDGVDGQLELAGPDETYEVVTRVYERAVWHTCNTRLRFYDVRFSGLNAVYVQIIMRSKVQGYFFKEWKILSTPRSVNRTPGPIRRRLFVSTQHLTSVLGVAFLAGLQILNSIIDQTWGNFGFFCTTLRNRAP